MTRKAGIAMSKEELIGAVEKAKAEFRTILSSMTDAAGSMPKELYAGYLNLQYHLTNGVQRHFFIAASHPDLAHKRRLREFLIGFGNEEESHFEIALRDLTSLGFDATEEAPFEVQLWRAYFNSIINERPFIRLGATCILENIGAGSADLVNSIFSKSAYINAKNSVFFRIHRHDESIPHGDQILAALFDFQPTAAQYADIIFGAKNGWKLYRNMLTALLEEGFK